MITVKSSFVAIIGNPCPRIYIPRNVNIIQAFVKYRYLSKLSQLHYQQNYVPMNQEIFGYPWALTQQIKIIPQ